MENGMNNENSDQKSGKILQFACDCVSRLHDVIRDPWSHVSRAGLISSETKEIILNKTYRQPKTVTQLAKEIGLSQPAIHKHVKEMLTTDMLRPASVSDSDKTYRVEQYYEPNFPVILMEDLSQMESLCDQMANEIAGLFWKNKDNLKQAFKGSSMENRGYELDDILDFLYSKIRRKGRKILDEQRFFPDVPVHKDGSEWLYWAEEIDDVTTDDMS